MLFRIAAFGFSQRCILRHTCILPFAHPPHTDSSLPNPLSFCLFSDLHPLLSHVPSQSGRPLLPQPHLALLFTTTRDHPLTIETTLALLLHLPPLLALPRRLRQEPTPRAGHSPSANRMAGQQRVRLATPLLHAYSLSPMTVMWPGLKGCPNRKHPGRWRDRRSGSAHVQIQIDGSR